MHPYRNLSLSLGFACVIGAFGYYGAAVLSDSSSIGIFFWAFVGALAVGGLLSLLVVTPTIFILCRYHLAGPASSVLVGLAASLILVSSITPLSMGLWSAAFVWLAVLFFICVSYPWAQALTNASSRRAKARGLS